jgi:hypothetical protein
MSEISPAAAACEAPLHDEPQAPPYILHLHGPPGNENESLPIYTEEDDPSAPITIQDLNNILADSHRPKENDVAVWRRYMDGLSRKQTDQESVFAERGIIKHYFSAIAAGQQDVIALLIENHLVEVNTKLAGMTPLLMAVSEKHVRIVQQLLELGAEPNEFGSAVSY